MRRPFMRTFLQYCLLTLIAFDVVVLGRLAFRGWPTHAVSGESGWVLKRVPFTTTDVRILIVILFAHAVVGYLYFRRRSSRSLGRHVRESRSICTRMRKSR